MIHGDISPNNLMLRMGDENNIGVLIDFDLGGATSAVQRTGTRPFVACDLLERNPPCHTVIHDLESLFFTSVWCLSRYHEGQVILTPPFQFLSYQWPYHDELAEKKRRFLRASIRKRVINFTSHFQALLLHPGWTRCAPSSNILNLQWDGRPPKKMPAVWRATTSPLISSFYFGRLLRRH